jgi:pyrroline-5-carboxylate reductase
VLEEKTIGLIGAGVMAEVLAEGLVRSKLVAPEDIVVSHYRRERLHEFQRQVPVQVTTSNREAYERSQVVVICVRPQVMGEVLEELRPVVDRSKVLTSIAAGLPISFYERALGSDLPFIRTMPTFFGRIKAGTTGLALNNATSAEDLAVVSRLFSTVSESVLVLPEDEMDAFTTFGSTTTATVYLLLDALMTAGSLVGLRHQASHSRAIEQVIAAAQNVVATDKLPSQLLDEICTPGGVTVEGVKILEERAARAAVIDGVLAAMERAGQLRRAADAN